MNLSDTPAIRTDAASRRPLEGRVALVTGGSRSIGAAIARRLASDGASVVVTYHASPERAQAVVDAITERGGTARAVAADAGDAQAVQAAVEATIAAHGRLDILVNNAGIAIVKPAGAFDLADFDRMIDVNVKGPFVATQAALRHMGEGGRIVNIGSVNSRYVPYGGGGLYVMTKAALDGLTHAFARDLGARGITINNVLPGPTDTDMNPADGEFAKVARQYVALGRYAHADEIADAVAYLASPKASYVTGTSLVVDGGYSA